MTISSDLNKPSATIASDGGDKPASAPRDPRWPGHAPAWRVGAGLTNDQLCFLIEAIAARRDRQAFAQLFEHFAPRLKGFGLKRGVDAASAEELAQETMLTVWRKADSFDRTRATVATWIFTILRNKRIDLFRREHYPEVELDDVAETAADTVDPDDAIQSSRLGQVLREAMRVLPKEQAEIIRLAFFEDKSHRVIADELRLPLGTVKSRVRLALIRLRNALPEGLSP